MRKSTRLATPETSPTGDELSDRLQQRVSDVLAVVAAFHAGPVTPESTFALEKKSLPFSARLAAMRSAAR